MITFISLALTDQRFAACIFIEKVKILPNQIRNTTMSEYNLQDREGLDGLGQNTTEKIITTLHFEGGKVTRSLFDGKYVYNIYRDEAKGSSITGPIPEMLYKELDPNGDQSVDHRSYDTILKAAFNNKKAALEDADKKREPINVGELPDDLQIGRASCRERV